MRWIWVFGWLLAGRFGRRLIEFPGRVVRWVIDLYTDDQTASVPWTIHFLLVFTGGALCVSLGHDSSKVFSYLLFLLGLFPFVLVASIKIFSLTVALLNFLYRSVRKTAVETWKESGEIVKTEAEAATDKEILLRPAEPVKEDCLLRPAGSEGLVEEEYLLRPRNSQ